MTGSHRAGQPEGRHTPEYVAAVGETGMFPVGAAGRESLAQHQAAGEDRGGRDDPDALALAAAQRQAGHRAAAK